MQFLTLIPDIIEEAAKTSILVSDRLFAIYCRSFDQYVQSGKLDIFCFRDVQHGKLKKEFFDFQTPLGSICQYRFTPKTIWQ